MYLVKTRAYLRFYNFRNDEQNFDNTVADKAVRREKCVITQKDKEVVECEQEKLSILGLNLLFKW